MGSILPCCLPCGKAGELQILCCLGFEINDYDFTLDALSQRSGDPVVGGSEALRFLQQGFTMLIFPNNCQFGSKFWIRLDEADAFVVNTHLKYSSGTRMQPLAQTWIKCECF